MTARISRHRVVQADGAGRRVPNGELNYWFHCPGCDEAHRFIVNGRDGRPSWTFDGNMEAPTFAPSLLMRSKRGEEQRQHVCHLFLRGGVLEFLGDCTHDLAGKQVPLPELPEWLR